MNTLLNVEEVLKEFRYSIEQMPTPIRAEAPHGKAENWEVLGVKVGTGYKIHLAVAKETFTVERCEGGQKTVKAWVLNNVNCGSNPGFGSSNLHDYIELTGKFETDGWVDEGNEIVRQGRKYASRLAMDEYGWLVCEKCINAVW